jgi:hypothetical protein
MEKMNKAKKVLIDDPSINAVCVTADGSVFDANDSQFADGHSQRFDDKSIDVYSMDDKFKKANKNLFFPGSRWSFNLISIDKPKPTKPKSPANKKPAKKGKSKS